MIHEVEVGFWWCQESSGGRKTGRREDQQIYHEIVDVLLCVVAGCLLFFLALGARYEPSTSDVQWTPRDKPKPKRSYL